MTDFTFDLVSSTRLEEQGHNFFSATLSGKQFTAEYFPIGKRIHLCMGFVHATPEQKRQLAHELEQKFSLAEDAVTFDRNTVNLMVMIQEDSLSSIDQMMEFMGTWAENNGIPGGCFLCGRADLPLHVSEVGEVRSVMCESCRSELKGELTKTTMVKANQTIRTGHGYGYITENYAMGILGVVVAAPITLMLWMITVMFIPFSFIVVPIATAAYFNLLYIVYKKLSGNLSRLGLVLSSVIGSLFLLISTLYLSAFNIAAGINLVAGTTVTSAFAVFGNIFSFLADPNYFLRYVFTLIFCLIGFIGGVIYRRFAER